MAKATTGNSISRILIIYTILVCVLLYAAYDCYQKDSITAAVFLIILALYLAFGIIRSLNNSAAPVIERQKIRSIRLKKAIPGLTRSRFEVAFENENGKIKKRLIMLPGSLDRGEEETKKALKIFEEEKMM